MEELTKDEVEIVKTFLLFYSDNHEIVDPTKGLNWETLSLGYFLAFGIKPDRSWKMATIARHTCNYHYDEQYFKKYLK